MYSLDSFLIKKSFFVDNKEYFYFSLEEFFKKFDIDSNFFPYSLKILLENNLRNEDGKRINASQIKNFARSVNLNKNILEILFYPTRVLMQDFTGVPAIADLAAMRTALSKKNIDPKKINPKIPVDLVIDHSVMVDQYGNNNAYSNNVKKEF